MPVLLHPLFERAIVGRAAIDSIKKMNPASLLKNPVMFVTEAGALLTTLGLFMGTKSEPAGFTFQISLWLWFTVLFANFAEAMAEGRGKAQADALRKTRACTMANLMVSVGLDRSHSRRTAEEGRRCGRVRAGDHPG